MDGLSDIIRCHCCCCNWWDTIIRWKATIIGTILGAFIIQLVGYTLIGNGVPDAVVLISKGLLIIISVWLQKNN